MQTIIEKKKIGLPANLRQQDEEKWAIVVGHARTLLTNRKSEIKKAVRDILFLMYILVPNSTAQLFASMNLDPKTGVLKATGHTRNGAVDGKQPIYHICKSLATTLGSKSKIATNITVTLQLCTRVAFLVCTCLPICDLHSLMLAPHVHSDFARASSSRTRTSRT